MYLLGMSAEKLTLTCLIALCAFENVSRVMCLVSVNVKSCSEKREGKMKLESLMAGFSFLSFLDAFL